MAWTPRTSRAGLEYGGSANAYYWSSLNPNAIFTDCLPNCTTYAYGRQLEQGRPKPVTSIVNAGSWESVTNTSGGWEYIKPFNVNALSVGDIVEWNGHLAVVEAIVGGIPYISNSVYTGDNGRAHDPPDSTHFSPRTPSVIGGSTIADVSRWAIANYPRRFFDYSTLSSTPWASGTPKGFLHYTGSEPPTPTPTPSGSVSPISVTVTMKKTEKYIDITMDVYMNNIPNDESASGGYTQPDIFERIYNTGWTYNASVEGYRNAYKTQTVRYKRESNKAQTINSYLRWDKDFSNGRLSIILPINIYVEASGTVMFLNPSIGSIDIR